jgi:multidrug efflux pump subunit AcrB
MKLGISGNITRAFIRSPLTPLILIASVLVGVIALVSLPREEEPQISVPMVDIFITADGVKAGDAVELVTKPLEDIVKAIDGVKHVYTRTEDDRVVTTVRFKVGTDFDRAIVRVHDKIRGNLNRIPIGIPPPLIVGRGIDDVAILTLTLTPKKADASRWNDNGLYLLAEKLKHELAKVEDVGYTYVVGGRASQIRIEPDPERLSLYGVTLNQLVDKLKAANRSFSVGALREAGKNRPVVAGQTLRGIPDIGLLVVTTRDGRPVYVKDVAKIVVGSAPVEHQAWHLTPNVKGGLDRRPAVTLAIAKRKGANAVTVAHAVLERLAILKRQQLPSDVNVVVTRNYGQTADDKANELLFHLALATASIVVLIALALGWREGIVVMVVIPTTILLTLFASWLMGYTINRVSLFALIFSIGILVDDAIVVVENIARHWARGAKEAIQAAIEAVAEVGNPTIIATLTIIVALLPMMFVSGLMGPYMSPIPANASAAMVFSFFVAVIITPWLLLRVAGRRAGAAGGHADAERVGWLGRFYLMVARPLLVGRWRSKVFLLVVLVATLGAVALFYTETVTVKLLPFDNKSEIQVVVDLPEGSSLEATERVLAAAADRLARLPELTSIQLYAGTAAPFNFNGLVRHYFLRSQPEQGDLQVNLLPKGDRDRTSHEIALDIRSRLNGLDVPKGTSIKVVEVPPGPPVLATLIAEIYGPSAKVRRETARKVETIFRKTGFLVDVDDSFGIRQQRLRFSINEENLEFYGVEHKAVYDTLAALLRGVRIGYSHRGDGITPIEIKLRLPKSALYPGERLLSTPVPGRTKNVDLAEVVRMKRETASYPLFRRDGHFLEMVTAELAGRFEAPIYGMLAVDKLIDRTTWPRGMKPVIRYAGQPKDDSKVSLLWDGEWEVTYVTFRDMGIAFGVAILAIYLLVVAQFGSFKLPLVILVPVPLTLIGIMLGHWLFGAPFTATSMIGFIALAGIIVRNSILLVDFIRARQAQGAPLRACLLEAGAVRFRPILLTALAAMIGAAVILLDPIFQGLAISLLFGLASSTALTVLVIPAIYVWLRDDHRGFEDAGAVPPVA